MNRIRLFGFAAPVLVATRAAAHPGHGDPSESGWLHYLAEPQHFFVLAAVLLAAAASATLLHARRRSEARRDRQR